jgi:mono/diheme cytochrome c family protein
MHRRIADGSERMEHLMPAASATSAPDPSGVISPRSGQVPAGKAATMAARRMALCAVLVGAALGLAATPVHSQTPAAISRGKDIAERVCAGCHAIGGRDGAALRADVPSFRALADRPYRTPESLQSYIMTPRHPMPAIPLELNEIRDIVDYIQSLK